MDRRGLLGGIAAIGALAVAGCDTASNIDSPSALASRSSEGTGRLVFGRLRWIENGQEKPIEQSLFGWWVAPRLKRIEDRRIINAEIDEGGHFLWDLGPGTYIIDRINYRDPMTGNYYFVPKVAFRVPSGTGPVYVGTLRADVATDRGFLGVSGTARFSVFDRLRADRDHVAARTGASLAGVTKSLMVQDERLPDSLDSTPEFNIAMTLLNGVL